MDKYVILNKTDFNGLIDKIAAGQKVVAPVRKGVKNFAFDEVTRGEQVALNYIPTILPPKKYFMPQREVIQEFDKSGLKWTPVVNGELLTVFGVHTCDLAGIQFLNKVMAGAPGDVNYNARKKLITVIGLECNDYCDQFASCAVMNNHLPDGGYDLFLTDLDDIYMVHVASEAGEKVVKDTGLFTDASAEHTQKLDALRAKKETIFKDEVNVKNEELKPLFARSFESKVWEDIDGRCVACGNCTNICPTCYCFDIQDDLNLDFNTGTRTRVWDSCQTEEFAKVAGNENFRKERGIRQLHRYMRKFNYPVDRVGLFGCTGCGRCSRTCMAQINLKETINALAEGAK